MDRADWAPSPADIGSVIRARTRDEFGNELGTFNTTTRPTDLQVMDEVDEILAELNGLCGPIPDGAQDNARRTAAVGAAAQVELSYWPEQVGTNRSPYDRLYARYLKLQAMLQKQVAEINAGDTPSDDIDLLPEASFPTCDQGMVGLNTRW